MRWLSSTSGACSVMMASKMTSSWRALLWRRWSCRTRGAPSTWVVRKTAVPGTRGGLSCSTSSRNLSKGTVASDSHRLRSSVPRFQVVMSRKRPAAMMSGTQPPWRILVTFAAAKARSMRRNPPATAAIRQAGQRQRRRASTPKRTVVMAMVPDAVGGAEGGRRSEGDHEEQAADHQSGVHCRDIDLAGLRARGVDDRYAGAVAQLDALVGEGEGAGDKGLGGDHGGERGQGEQRIEKSGGGQEIEGVRYRLRLSEHERALAEVVEHEGRQHHDEPREPDRTAPEVAHVGVKRLGSGDGEHDGPQDKKACGSVAREKLEAVPGIEGEENGGGPSDLDSAEGPDGREPHEHDGPEDPAHAPRAVALADEEEEENGQGGGHHEVAQLGHSDLEPLDGAQHGDGRRDDAVAVEEGGAEEPERDDEAVAPLLGEQGEQGNDAAFAAVVQAHDHQHVLDGDNQDQ